MQLQKYVFPPPQLQPITAVNVTFTEHIQHPHPLFSILATSVKIKAINPED